MKWFEEVFLKSFLDRGLGDKNHELTITRKQQDIFERYVNFGTDSLYRFSYVGKGFGYKFILTPIPNSSKYSRIMIFAE